VKPAPTAEVMKTAVKEPAVRAHPIEARGCSSASTAAARTAHVAGPCSSESETWDLASAVNCGLQVLRNCLKLTI